MLAETITEHSPDLDPISVASVVLTVHDLDGVAAFYQRAVGLHLIRREGDTVELGIGTRVLLELRLDRTARRRAPQEAGLFHTAFLLPSRGDLGRWLRHASGTGLPLQGLSDHIVSEAAYLSDPEGNGIEIYSDRPRASWRWTNGQVAMATERMDVEGVLGAAAPTPWDGVPEGTIVGHVHLQVGELVRADSFYAGTLGFDITTHYPGATFYATGGYHHHLAANVWQSRGAGTRAMPSTGLTEVRLAVREPERLARLAEKGRNDGKDAILTDPWGTPTRLTLGS